MARITLSVVLGVFLLVSGPVASYGDKYEWLARAIRATQKGKPLPTPSPSPNVAGVCPDCNGTGRMGDGRIEFKCPKCGGTGKVAATPLATSSGPPEDSSKVIVIYGDTGLPEHVWPHYPVRGRWWTGCKDWHHLASGEHAGKFDVQWLQNLSNEEIQSLHSDDHEGKVDWDKAVRGPGKFSSAKSSSGCPPGGCPTSRFVPRLFGRR